MTSPTTATAPLVRVKDMPAQEYLGMRFSAATATVGHDVQAAFARVYGHIGQAGSQPSGPPFLIASQPEDGVMQLEVGAPCVPVPEPAAGMHAGRLDAGRAAVLVHRGSYDGIGPSYTELFAWVAREGYRPAGPPREVYLNGPDEVKDPAEYLTEIVLPIDRPNDD